MKLHGKIVAADSDERTITIQCDSSIGGITMGSRAILTDENSYNSWDNETALERLMNASDEP